MFSLLGLRNQVTSQERRNTELATSNTSLRKQAAEHQVQQAELKAKNDELEVKVASLEKELTTSEVVCAVANAEMEVTLIQMKSVVVDVNIHARVELMEEFMVGQHVDWDPNFEIGVWKDKEAELAEANDKGETIEEPSSPRVEIPGLIELAKEVDEPAQVEVATKGPSVEDEKPRQEYIAPFVFLLFCYI